jgi:hypothetical protein
MSGRYVQLDRWFHEHVESLLPLRYDHEGSRAKPDPGCNEEANAKDHGGRVCRGIRRVSVSSHEIRENSRVEWPVRADEPEA